ncbi:MAG: formylglycine-generating enzyme family protein [Acidobacteriota bacterium]|nr:formylglycine-generating enzyme family protein [Acidobacteriota bacterium]
MINSPDSNEQPTESRLIPFAVAGIFCFALALISGVGGWYLFGTNHRSAPEKKTAAVQTSNQNSAVENSNSNNNSSAPAPNPTAVPEIKNAPAGEIPIGGGEVTLGGGDTKLPLRRVAVAPFAVGETEVTNAQYAEFIKDTDHQSPSGWKKDKFPNGTASEPVVNISWSDANDYCEWLSKQIGATARLPSEAEWELAARGNTDSVYPWGSKWDDEAAESAETNGRVRPVKSFPKGRSASGAYDMIGNVYEWTSDLLTDEFGKPVLYEKANRRVIKGGAFGVEREILTIKSHDSRPENKPSKMLGFRYVVVRK